MDPAQEERQEEARAFELHFTESVAAELRAVGSQLPPGEGEPIEAFRHVAIGAAYAWCERLYIDEDRRGDAGEHTELADRYGWSAAEYRIVAEAAEAELC